MNSHEDADPFEQIERTILQIGWLGQRQFMQLLAEDRFDLTIPQYHTLLQLSIFEGVCKMSDLARATHQSAASMTGIVDRLLDKRLVERARLDDDRRQVMVAATPRGRELLAEIREARREALRLALRGADQLDLAALQHMLDALLERMRRSADGTEQRP
jgi:DNA-binding MarR family transcriptional regulator